MVPENFGIAFSNLADFLLSCSLVAIRLGTAKGMVENKKERTRAKYNGLSLHRCCVVGHKNNVKH